MSRPPHLPYVTVIACGGTTVRCETRPLPPAPSPAPLETDPVRRLQMISMRFILKYKQIKQNRTRTAYVPTHHDHTPKHTHTLTYIHAHTYTLHTYTLHTYTLHREFSSLLVLPDPVHSQESARPARTAEELLAACAGRRSPTDPSPCPPRSLVYALRVSLIAFSLLRRSDAWLRPSPFRKSQCESVSVKVSV